MTRAIVSAIAIALAVWSWIGQQQTPPTFRSTAEMVTIYATVLDRDGHLVSGLQQSDFTVLDNGAPRDIVAFSNETQPTTVSLLLDRSGSTSGRERDIRTAARAFVGDLLPEDRVSVSTLFWDCQPLTTDHAAVLRTIETGLRVDLGSPIWRALDRMMTSLDQERGRRAILILSDGKDEGLVAQKPSLSPPCRFSEMLDEVSTDQVIAHARQEGLLVYAVVVPTQGSNDSELRQIVKNSGGAAYVMKPSGDVTTAFRAIVDELHHQYVLGVMPVVFDDEVHTIEVKTKSGLTVRARKSYIASHADARGEGADAIAFEKRQPWPAITDREVQNAIADGAVGRTFFASCTAARAFGSPIETMTSVEVVAEGPVGRIMRASTASKGALDVVGVSPDLRAATVTITATRPRCTNTMCAADLTAMAVQGHGKKPIVLAPVAPAAVTTDGTRITASFSMTDFKGLPGNDVEVVVTSGAGDRKCRFAKADVAMIR